MPVALNPPLQIGDWFWYGDRLRPGVLLYLAVALLAAGATYWGIIALYSWIVSHTGKYNKLRKLDIEFRAILADLQSKGDHPPLADLDRITATLAKLNSEYHLIAVSDGIHPKVEAQILKKCAAIQRVIASLMFDAADLYRKNNQPLDAKEAYRNVIRYFTGPEHQGFRDRANMELQALQEEQSESRKPTAPEGRSERTGEAKPWIIK